MARPLRPILKPLQTQTTTTPTTPLMRFQVMQPNGLIPIGDGVGNNKDLDDDGDKVDDAVDLFPTDPNEWLDTDGDGIGDNADPIDPPALGKPSGTAFTVDENTFKVAALGPTDPQGSSLSTTLSGANADLFFVDSAGVLTFRAEPDYETLGPDALYITVTITNSFGLSAKADYSVKVRDIIENTFDDCRFDACQFEF